MDGIEYTYEDAGKVCGVSSETIRHRLKRGKLRRGRPTNTGRPTVILTAEDIAIVSAGRPAGGQPGVQPPGHDRSNSLSDNGLAGRLAAAEERADRMQAERDAERARADQATAEREAARIAAAAAEGKAEGLQAALRAAEAHAATLQAEAARERAVAQTLLQAEAAERQAAEMAREELAAWRQGGPLTRALRAFWRRG